MKLIFAQGNPEPQYERTRHNVGFLALNSLAKAENATWKLETKHRALVAQVNVAGEKALLVKPQTFYNDTGLSARSLVDFYKLNPATDVLVIHDDLALPFGTVRVRDSGSDAGNNGIRSLNAHLGPSYVRIRVGIWSELRERMDSADFVLSTFSGDEKQHLDSKILPAVLTFVDNFLKDTLAPDSIKTINLD